MEKNENLSKEIKVIKIEASVNYRTKQYNKNLLDGLTSKVVEQNRSDSKVDRR